jgi:hypothetical protein
MLPRLRVYQEMDFTGANAGSLSVPVELNGFPLNKPVDVLGFGL